MKLSCPHCHSENIILTKSNKFNLDVYVCNDCNVKFNPNANGEIDSWSFNVTIGPRKYKLVFLMDIAGHPEFIVFAQDDSLLGKEIFKLNFLPNITPDNAQNKLSTYLLFL